MPVIHKNNHYESFVVYIGEKMPPPGPSVQNVCFGGRCYGFDSRVVGEIFRIKGVTSDASYVTLQSERMAKRVHPCSSQEPFSN